METVGHEIRRIETRLRQMGNKLDRLAAQADAAGTEATSDYRRQIDHTKDKHTVVQGKLKAYRDANGQKWDSFRAGVETAWHEFADAFKAIEPRPDLGKRESPPQ